jgi:hypothetical protein
VRVFQENQDLPLIKPKTTVTNKNEFNVNLERPLIEERIDPKVL